MPAGKKPKEVAKKDAKKVELEVLVEKHIHEGKPCKKGDKIMVTEDVAGMLKKAWTVHNAAS